MYQGNQEYDMFLDIDDNDVFIRKYSNDNIPIYNKRLSPSPDLIINNKHYNKYDNEHEDSDADKDIYPINNTHIIDVSSRVKLLYILFVIIIFYVYHLFTSIYVIIK